ncbi:MAG: hypothetical protein J6L72_07135 [Butyricicoccus sp.]|nr:hypothetical protein [Butyricicoccus sp.]
MEKRLVDVKKLIEHCLDAVSKLEDQGDITAAYAIKIYVLWYLADVEPVDAVPVVRCRDCVHGIGGNGGIACTEFCNVIHKPEDFCSRGERKEDYD